MKTLLSIIFAISLTATASVLTAKTSKKTSANSWETKYELLPEDTVTHFDTLQLNSQRYVQISKNRAFKCLLSMQGDTIIKWEDYYFKAELLDINEDGYTDIRIFIFSNTPNQCDNYFFDKDSKTFKRIEGCDLDVKKLKGTQFYYSYNRAGCSDMNWQSYLSKIENHKLVEYGYIDGQGCEAEPQVIEIYKIRREDYSKRKLVKKLPYNKYITDFGDKWSFIEEYWSKNFKKFDR